MPESSCLHIQDSASGPIRVLEIPWPLVRVGRASHCEVRLNAPELAGEVCRIQRRGATWQIEPLVADAIEIEGRPVNGIRLLSFQTPIQIGPYCLTLHASKLAAPDWGLYESRDAVSSRSEAAVKLEAAIPIPWEASPSTRGTMPNSSPIPAPESPRPAPEFDAHAARLDRTGEPERPASPLRDRQRWENRWRAAGEKLRAASPPKAPPGSVDHRPAGTASIDADRPLPHSVPQAYQLEPIPLKEAILPRPPIARSIKTAQEPVVWNRRTEPEVARMGGVRVPQGQSRTVAPPPNSPGPSWTIGMPADQALARIVGNSPSPTELELTAELGSGSDSTLVPAPPSDSLYAPPSHADESTVDERISSWNPTWFDQHTGPNEAASELTPAETDAGEVDLRFEAGTVWVAPAECLGTITTLSEDESYSEPPVGFIASMLDPDGRASDPRHSGPIEAGPTAVPRRDGDGSELVAGSESERTRRPTRSTSRSEELLNTSVPRTFETTSRVPHGDWPSVDDILAAHRRASAPVEDPKSTSSSEQQSRKSTRGSKLAAPSLARSPDCWEVPLWLGWPPLAFASLLLGVLGCVMSWSWASESRSASIVANRLLGKEAEVIHGRSIPLPDGVVPPSPKWWRSTPRHLTNWAVYLARGADSADRADEIRELLDGAIAASPTYAPARLALARIDDLRAVTTDVVSTRGLALSRDPISLAWAARKLLKAGRKDAALPLYRRALSLATLPEFSPESIPRFADDPQAERYLLPGEDLTREILANLVSDRGLSFAEWSSVLPEGTVAPLVAARLLRERNRRDSEAALDLILGRDAAPDSEGTSSAIRLAVRAEAFAMRAKWKDAEREYRAAIDGIDHDPTSRSWWFNLAGIERRLNDETRRQEAIRKALAWASSNDEIARRAADLRRGGQATSAAEGPRVRGVGLKAN